MTTAINKTATRTTTRTNENTFGKTTIAMFGASSMLIGVWAAACFVGAIVSAGPIGLVQGFISAVTGI
ncbi:MAG: hypothetical protein KKG47_02560 [Proteobacteria bacterium]|nr:hypothetical protein [Pseudomonadota bacterium]MBU1738026.1 hypothetical protein [Pseudomonadota bacterium]